LAITIYRQSLLALHLKIDINLDLITSIKFIYWCLAIKLLYIP